MKIFYCLMLVISIIGPSYAQDNKTTASEKAFEIKPDYFRLKYEIDLGKGNKLQIELRDIKDLNYVANPDSLLRTFLSEILPLKDSLSNELSSKRIDYITDSAGRKKIRFQQFKPAASNFVVDHGDLALLKLDQDTVNFKMPFFDGRNYLKKGTANIKYYRLSFFVNQLEDLNNYHDGSLNEKIIRLRQNVNASWEGGKDKSRVYLKDEPSVSAAHPKGYLNMKGIAIGLGPSLNLQNYKSYFVPSFSVGALFTISESSFKKEVGIYWEPNFFFAKNAQGDLQTFRNDFLTLVLGHGFIKDNDPRKNSNLLAIFSYGYVVRRSGDFISKHTSRFGIGQFNFLSGQVRLEPAICFNDFLKNVTPSLRLGVGF